MIMNNIKLILLDFDGTLVDTYKANSLAYIDTLEEIGLTLSEHAYKTKYFGMRCCEFMHTMGIEDPAEQERLRQRKIALYPRHFQHTKLNQPLWDFCQSFREGGGKVWIVSTGSRKNIVNVMAHIGIGSEQLDGILTGEDVHNCKPAPDCFLQAINTEGVLPSQTLIFEDSDIGLEAAARSGASYIKVAL